MFSSILALSLATTPAAMVNPQVELVVQGRGTVTVEIRKDQAPKLAAHFMDLVDAGFYNGLLFHRKVDGFVAQAGDPKSRTVTPAWARANPGEYGGTETLGDGGSGKSVTYEVNDLQHHKYSVGMALEAPMSDTGDSQFFINLADNHRLNGLYCVFGQVVKGMDVVDRIERGDRITRIRRVTASRAAGR